ncbi:MAG: hypothetical protein ACD_60C00086G0004 [uncultured bacterium]|nr:MAG: hypothetical protein ACD_60C00086G0004 [uncultured bacterium]
MSSSDRDFQFKLIGKRMAWALGYVPLLNVPILLPESASNRSGIELSDADVFGVRFGPSGQVSRMLIDCKTTTGRAVDRVLWVKGLHTFLALDELYLFKTRIPANARWLAKELNINCLDEEEIEALEERLGLHRLKGPYFDGTGYEQVRLMFTSFPKGSDYRAIVQFLTGGIWTLSPAKRVITLTNLGGQNNLNRKLRPSEPAHVVLVLQGALMLAISLGLLASQLNVVDTLNVEKRLREELHGGADFLEQKVRYLDVLSRLSLESGADVREATIDFDGFPSLLEQVNRLIVRRYALNDATRVIDLALHYLAVGSSGLPGHLGGTQTSLPAKIASDILSLFVRSNGFDEKFSSAIIALLEERDDQPEKDTITQPSPIASGTQVSLLDPLPPMENQDQRYRSRIVLEN